MYVYLYGECTHSFECKHVNLSLQNSIIKTYPLIVLTDILCTLEYLIVLGCKKKPFDIQTTYKLIA